MSFATSGAPTEVDLWTGRPTRLGRSVRHGGRVTLPVALAAGDTALLTFDRRRGRRGESRPRRLPGSLAVRGPWRVSAQTTAPSGDAKVERTLPALTAWGNIAELRGKSGTGTYTATVRVPTRWLRRGRGVLLDPGAFGGGLRLWVNGRRVASPPVPRESPTDVTRALRAGTNALRLEVSTTLNNAIVTQGLAGDPDYAGYATRPLQTYGLLGPVRLIPYTRRRAPPGYSCRVSPARRVSQDAPIEERLDMSRTSFTGLRAALVVCVMALLAAPAVGASAGVSSATRHPAPRPRPARRVPTS